MFELLLLLFQLRDYVQQISLWADCLATR